MPEVRERSMYYLLNVAGYRVAISKSPMEGAEVVGDGVEAGSFEEAKSKLADRAAELQALIDGQRGRADLQAEDSEIAERGVPAADVPPMFRSAHDALVFAFRFSHDQSPRTPMTALMQRGLLGKGKGLVGIEGAGQAGLIHGALRRLSDEQKNLLVARYGDIRQPCQCCGQMAPTPEWRAAVDALSHCAELHDLPKPIRLAAIEKIVCRRRNIETRRLAAEHEMSPRTLRHRISDCKARLAKIENSAIAMLEEEFKGSGLVSSA